MHVGMVTAVYEPVVNGVTQMIAQYRRHLEAAGHRVTIFTLGDPPPGEEATKVIRSPAVPLGGTGYHFALRYSPRAQERLGEVEIIHCHHLLMALEFAHRYGRAPIVFTNHTRYDLYLGAYGRLPAWLAKTIAGFGWRRLTDYADVVIAPSASTRAIMRGSGVGRPIEVIENGVEVDRFRSAASVRERSDFGVPPGALVFTFVGRLAPEKRLDQLAQAFSLVAGQVDDAHLLLAGDGPLRDGLERKLAAKGWGDRVHFCGRVAPEEVPSVLHASDVFVSASESEVHPLSIIEALVAGLPVVGVAGPGVGDVVAHERSGLLVDGSPPSLARAMIALAQDATYRRRLGAGASREGARYDIELTIERTLSLYRRLVQGHDQVPVQTSPARGQFASGSRQASARREARIKEFYGEGSGGR